MKKLGVVVCFVSLLILASCGTSSTPAETTPVETAVVEATPVETVNIEEEVLSEEDSAAYEAEQAAAAQEQAALEADLAEVELETMLSGSFVGIAPGHNTVGGVTVKDNGDNVIIELSEDFLADTGPDLYVTLTQEQPLTGADPLQLDTSKIQTVAPLVNLGGTQSYEISKADFEEMGYAIVIWCKQYNVVFGSAILN